ncbi:hypothetical protein LOD99_9815 [Oopsacas minuta]|uniref:MATH domain-containing protein n=1 Tax=Oopsacas minuta TaxID=111878 RepID=A0AAV7KM10_9METZ|nr:hypothetical protein LOD99_9815 [Oopsacas minuta]
MCQENIVWNHDNTGKVGVFIRIMKGEYYDKLHWPIKYKYTFVLLDQFNSNDNLIYSGQITKECLVKCPESFMRPTDLTNLGYGKFAFISITEILEDKYRKEDSITLQITVELLPLL